MDEAARETIRAYQAIQGGIVCVQLKSAADRCSFLSGSRSGAGCLDQTQVDLIQVDRAVHEENDRAPKHARGGDHEAGDDRPTPAPREAGADHACADQNQHEGHEEGDQELGEAALLGHASSLRDPAAEVGYTRR